jgi:hypothetical protein
MTAYGVHAWRRAESIDTFAAKVLPQPEVTRP